MSSASIIKQAVPDRLRPSLEGMRHTIDWELDEGVLVLRGTAPSFYCKQLAQEAVTRVEGVVQVINKIDVCRVSDDGRRASW